MVQGWRVKLRVRSKAGRCGPGLEDQHADVVQGWIGRLDCRCLNSKYYHSMYIIIALHVCACVRACVRACVCTE